MLPLFGNYSAAHETQNIRECEICGAWCDIVPDIDHANLVCPCCKAVRLADYDDLVTVGDLADELEMYRG